MALTSLTLPEPLLPPSPSACVNWAKVEVTPGKFIANARSESCSQINIYCFLRCVELSARLLSPEVFPALNSLVLIISF